MPQHYSWHYRVSQEKVNPFPEEASEDLEEAYQNWQRRGKPNEGVVLRSGKYEYSLDFAKMEQTNTRTRRARELVRSETRVGQELARCQAELQQVKADLNRKSQELEAKEQYAVQAWEQERAALQGAIKSSEQHAHQLQQQLVQQQQATLKSEEELRKARAELQAFEGQGAEVVRLRAELEALQRGKCQWEFLNHFDSWQPYSEEMSRKMDALQQQWRDEGQPDKVYQLSDRYEVSFFQGPVQINTKHRTSRRLRQQPVPGFPLKEPNANEGAHADLREQLEEQQEQAREEVAQLRLRLAANEEEYQEQIALLREKLRERLQEKEEQIEALGRSKQELEEEAVERQSRLDSCAYVIERMQEQVEAEAAEKMQQLHAKEQVEAEAAEKEQQLHAKEQELADLLCMVKHGQEQVEAEAAEKEQHLHAKEQELADLHWKLEHMQEQVEAEAAEKEQYLHAKEQVEAEAAEKEQYLHAKELKKFKDKKELKERKEKTAQLKRMQEQHGLLVANVLTREYRSLKQAQLARELAEALDKRSTEHGDEDELLQGTGLVDPLAQEMLHASARFHKAALGLSSSVIDAFGELREPDTQEVVDCTTILNPDCADYVFIKYLFQRSLTKHRLNYHGRERCERPRLRVVSIELLARAPKHVRHYRSERDRIGKRGDLPDIPFPLNGAIRPLVAKDTNEFMLFHGCPWGSVPSICAQGFDWKFRGSNQGAMFGQGIYFASNASKCDGYSDTNSEGLKCVFLARVLLGHSVPRWRKCTETKSLGKDLDSICAATREFGGSVDHPEVCIFQKSQALPVAKIVYLHEDTCACHRCRSERGET